MKRVDIKLGFVCNNHCKFCVQGDKRNYSSDKETGEVKSILKNCRKSGIDSVVFTGGEPTVRNDIIELVRFARILGFETIQIQTNGRLFSYLNFCKEIIDAGATEFSPALHGPDAKIHDFLTSVNESFNQTVKGIENLKKLGKCVMTNTVITTYNYKYLPQIAKLLVNLEVDQFQFAFIHIAGTAVLNADWIVPRKRDVMPYVKKGLDNGIKRGKRVMTEAIPYCLMQGYEEYIAERIIPDTEVFDADFIVQNYTDYRKKRGKIKSPHCKNCKYYCICEGPWKEYPEMFGWDEFRPVDNKL